MANDANIPASDRESISPQKLRYEASRDVPDDMSNDVIGVLRLAADEIERLREALNLISKASVTDLMLDPTWAQRISRAALRLSSEGGENE